MHKIVDKKMLADEIVLMTFEAPLIAQERKPGQFVILQVDEEWGERIPLTIADADVETGTITIIFQTVGHTTHLLGRKEVGDAIPAVLGPLGTPTHIKKYGTVVCVGGGIGVAPLHPIVKALKEAGNTVKVIMGARTGASMILVEEMKRASDEVVMVTDDGSRGRQGLVTDPLQELCSQTPLPDCVVAIGPPIMMKACCDITKPYGIQTFVSLNTIMIDGTGMCGGCRVTVGNKTRFVCVDGPEFDGHQVDFDSMMQRQSSYRDEENWQHAEFHKTHQCCIDAQIEKQQGI